MEAHTEELAGAEIQGPEGWTTSATERPSLTRDRRVEGKRKGKGLEKPSLQMENSQRPIFLLQERSYMLENVLEF